MEYSVKHSFQNSEINFWKLNSRSCFFWNSLSCNSIFGPKNYDIFLIFQNQLFTGRISKNVEFWKLNFYRNVGYLTSFCRRIYAALCGNRTRWPSRKRTPVYITIDRFLKRFIRPFHFFQYSCFSVSNSITSSNQGHSKIPKKSSTRIFSVAHKIRCEPMEFVARLQSNLRGETSEVLVNWIFKYFVKSVILPHFNHTDTFLLILFFCYP